MEKDFTGFDGAFADFFDSQRSIKGSFKDVAVKGANKKEYAMNAAIDLSNLAQLGRK